MLSIQRNIIYSRTQPYTYFKFGWEKMKKFFNQNGENIASQQELLNFESSWRSTRTNFNVFLKIQRCLFHSPILFDLKGNTKVETPFIQHPNFIYGRCPLQFILFIIRYFALYLLQLSLNKNAILNEIDGRISISCYSKWNYLLPLDLVSKRNSPLFFKLVIYIST